MRKLFFAANWKMNHVREDVANFITQFPLKLSGITTEQVDIAICSPFVYLTQLIALVQEQNQKYNLNIKVGAQNMYFETKGAYTGEISPKMLKDIGCSYVILGHSERRQIFGEADALINKKIKAAFSFGLLPIICVGETKDQRLQNQTLDVVRRQLQGALEGLTPAQVEASTIAYEPVWAIGTGLAATPDMAQEVHKMIRDYMLQNYGNSVAESVRIQYGGSVTPENSKSLMSQNDIDGALVGGASLQPESFAQLIVNGHNNSKK